ncbi:cytochrome P450 [Nitriliruptor alkaliphilus]|uniref:cytochrome P450 n=1 Tax=Nitriliruptor alkaliphilus TaxID=427918 RepID=UPI0006964390|nr:cytochrome P450 [Nitriliruptor alkaliphilus]
MPRVRADGAGPGGDPLLGHLRPFVADRLGFLTRLSREHGDVASFRIGPYRNWQLTHPDHVREVLVTHAAKVRKGPILQRARIVLGDGLLTSEGDRHRRDRRVLQQAFHPRRVASYAATMVEHADAATGRWEPGVAVDVHAELVRATLATAGATLLGANVADDVDLVERALADLLSAYKLAFIPFGWRLQWLPIGPPRRLRRGRSALHDLVDRTIAERRASGEDRGDLLSALTLADDGGFTDAALRDHAVTLLLAGHETTANALTFACHLLATAPEVDAAVHTEVDQVLAGRLPTADDLDQLPRCRALFAEALRLYPPSWAMGRQLRADLQVGDVRIPAGDLVVLPQWVVHRDPRWWPEPERCQLERWTDATDRERPRGAFFPFGAGVRQCIGEGFAWTEGVLALATIVRRWRFAPVPGRQLQLDPLLTLRPRNGCWLHALPRRS